MLDSDAKLNARPLASVSPAELRRAAHKHAIAGGQEAIADFWKHEIQLQDRLQTSEGFWSDVVGRLKREKRYLEAAIMCREALPVPAAYSQLLICLRHLYVKGADNRSLLQETHRLATESDLLYRVRSVELDTAQGKTMVPVFNVASIVYQWMRLGEYPIDYEKIGFKFVRSLNATDRSRLAAELGDPGVHLDPFEVGRPLWEKGILECASRLARMRQESADELAALLRSPRLQE